MNINAFTIYLWQLADSVKFALGPILFAVILYALFRIGYAFYLQVCSDPRPDPYETEEKAKARSEWAISILSKHKKASHAAVLWCALCSLIHVATPSSNTIAMMVVIPKITESKVIQQDLPDLYNAAVEALKQQLKK